MNIQEVAASRSTARCGRDRVVGPLPLPCARGARLLPVGIRCAAWTGVARDMLLPRALRLLGFRPLPTATRVPCHHQMHQGRTKCTPGAQQAVQSRSRNGSATWCTRISCWQHWGRRPRAPGRGGKTVEAWLEPLHWMHASPRLMAALLSATTRGDEAWSGPRLFRHEANASAMVGREGGWKHCRDVANRNRKQLAKMCFGFEN